MNYKKSKAALLLLGAVALTPTVYAHNNGGYSHDYSAVANNPDWMARVSGANKVSELSLPGTHDTMSIKSGDIWQNQTMTLSQQLKSGLRVFGMRTRHINDGFRMHHGMIAQDTYFNEVLADIESFLAAHPSETVLFRLRSEHSSENNTRSYEETLKSYLANTTRRYTGASDNPTLDEIRGKFVILQEFGGADYGIPYSGLDKQDDYSMGTNWDLYDKWTSVKNHINKAKNGSRDTIYMNFLSGAGGSFPYFVASGHSSPGTSAARLSTGLTTPGWNSSYPDFPRTTCFIGICTISFEGTNVLTANYIANGGFTGIVMADFPGARLIENVINLNEKSSGNAEKINEMQLGYGYDFKLNTEAGGKNCRLEWDSSLSSNERNAKFDCNSSGDPMSFVPTANPWVDSNGYHAIKGYIMTQAGGTNCGLEWDSSLSSGERNAKFDCDGGKDEMYITSHADGGLDNVIITSVSPLCGLQWNGGSADSNGERNAKFDCAPAWDPMSMVITAQANNTYYRYGDAALPVAGYWGNLQVSPDALLNWDNGKTYAFVGSNYYRIDNNTGLVDKGPTPISGNWGDLPWSSIDAAVKYNDTYAYFFKGSQYVYMNMETKAVSSIRNIGSGWGLTGDFAQGVDAAINWGNGKIYFFKGHQYTRYDISDSSVDSGYPAAIDGNWDVVTGPIKSVSKGILSNTYLFK